ncbi:hypothetical protein PI95_022470 [Hassallia byssoidea VB512170]|uniref:Uncharacterized protein n=1 Tax=Hassallia byssoidea VB512170 TaxID=1304833 RepID=A0A846HCH2_9CYAN|nr:hypothetical protein [Hassalia byssoidea]NEU75247.1 hypothetical protein [Hassalia byssoidea VB512170]
MSLTKWFLTVAVSGSLTFTAVTSPKQFPSLAVVGLPLLSQILENRLDKGCSKDDKNNEAKLR